MIWALLASSTPWVTPDTKHLAKHYNNYHVTSYDILYYDTIYNDNYDHTNDAIHYTINNIDSSIAMHVAAAFPRGCAGFFRSII